MPQSGPELGLETFCYLLDPAWPDYLTGLGTILVSGPYGPMAPFGVHFWAALLRFLAAVFWGPMAPFGPQWPHWPICPWVLAGSAGTDLTHILYSAFGLQVDGPQAGQGTKHPKRHTASFCPSHAGPKLFLLWCTQIPSHSWTKRVAPDSCCDRSA